MKKPVIQTQYGSIYQNWKLESFPNCVFFQEGPGLRNWQFTDSGMKVINVKNILLDGTIDTSNSYRFISLEEFRNKYNHFAIQSGDIVVSSSGWSYGKVGRIKSADLPLMMNTSVIRFRPLNGENLDSDYLYNFLRSPFFRNQIESFIIGCQQPNFGPAHIKRMVIPIPPITTQRKIAAVLSAYDDLIENNRRRIEVLEEMARLLYREWFVNFRFPGHEQVKMVDSELRLIPKGWEVKNLFDIAEVTYGFPFKSKQFTEKPIGKPVIRIRDIKNSITKTFTTESAADKYIVCNGDILVGMDGDFHRAKWFGGKAYLNQRVVRFRPKNNLSFYYLFLALEDPIKYFDSTVVGTTVAHLSDRHLRSINLIIPDKSLCERVKDMFDSLFKLELDLHLKNTNLRKTRDLLLPKLISGEIDVENLQINIGEIAA
jgi:type I restriction enzyme S subunit